MKNVFFPYILRKIFSRKNGIDLEITLRCNARCLHCSRHCNIIKSVPDDMTLEQIEAECECGSYSGYSNKKIENQEIEGIDAANATRAQGSSCDFFGMDEDGNEIEEW